MLDPVGELAARIATPAGPRLELGTVQQPPVGETVLVVTADQAWTCILPSSIPVPAVGAVVKVRVEGNIRTVQEIYGSNNYSLIDKLVRFTTAVGKPTTNNYEGKIAQEIDNGNLFIYDGAQWQILPGSTFTCTSGTRPTAPYTVYQGLRIWETDTKAWGVYDGANWVMWDTQWQTYAPGWWSSATQPSIGNGSITGKYLRSGRECSVHMALIAGSTTTYGSGQYYFSIPSAMSSPHLSNVTLGTAWAINQGNYYMTGVVNMQGTMVSVFLPASLTNTNSGQWGATSPWAFKNTDQMSVYFRYPMA